MLPIPGSAVRTCKGWSRRELLRAGALGTVGLSLPQLFRLEQARAGNTPRPAADVCILIFLWGAPSQYETFDPKPDVPAGIRDPLGRLLPITRGEPMRELF